MSELVPEQTVIARAVNIGVQTTGSGKEYVSVDFPVDHDGDEVLVEAKLWLTEKAMKRTIASLRLMGWWGDDLYKLKEEGALRNEVSIDIRHEEYPAGKFTARVAFINEKPANPEELEKKKLELARKFKSLAQETKPATKPDDDLPF